MAVTIKEGNILNAKEVIIAHQVNGLGIMGGGLAKQIKQTYPYVYDTYSNFVQQYETPESLLGLNLLVRADGEKIDENISNDLDTKIISNLFGQAYVDTSKQETNLQALKQALNDLANFAKENKLSVALPYGIGCGLGGADWNDVYELIQDAFHNHSVTLYRYTEV